MGALKEYTNYLQTLGLNNITDYDYKNKSLNINLEIERLLNRSCMMFMWHNLPETIPQEQMEKILQTQGYAIIGEDNGKIYAFYGSLGGELDEYFRPTKAIVNNPYLKLNKTWEIDKNCVVLKNDLMYQGFLPLYAKYVSQLIECDVSMIVALINTRVQAYISASDNKSIESAKQYLKDLEEGKLGVIADSAMLESVKVNAVKDNYNLSNIRETIQYIKGQLYNEIGLATNYNLKKERITTAEIELNTDYLYPLLDNLYQCRQEGIEKINAMFDMDLEVEFNSSWDYRTLQGEPIVTKGDIDDNVLSNINNDVIDSSVSNKSMAIDSNDKRNVIQLETPNTNETKNNNDYGGDISDNDNNNIAINSDSSLENVEDTMMDIQEDLDAIKTDMEELKDNVMEILENDTNE